MHVNIKTYHKKFSVEAFKPVLCKITTNIKHKPKKLPFVKKNPVDENCAAWIISRYMRICEKAKLKLKLSRHRFYRIWWIIACTRFFFHPSPSLILFAMLLPSFCFMRGSRRGYVMDDKKMKINCNLAFASCRGWW